MARTPEPVRHLTAAELGVDAYEVDQHAGEKEIVSFPPVAPTKRIPAQVNAPINTNIEDYRLIWVPGRPIKQADDINEVSRYLEDRFSQIISDIEGQATRIIVDDFRQGKYLLSNWSISKLLAFGTHLYLLEDHTKESRQEVLADKARRLDSLMRSAREFVSSFKEWQQYVEQSTRLNISIGEGREEIITAAKDAAEDLILGAESVESQIPSALQKYASIAFDKRSNQSAVVSVMSALSSIANISITFTKYVAKIAKEGYASVNKNDRAMKLLKTICRFFTVAMRLSATFPEFSFLLNHSVEIRAACDLLEP